MAVDEQVESASPVPAGRKGRVVRADDKSVAFLRLPPLALPLLIIALGLLQSISIPGRLTCLWSPAAGLALALLIWFGPTALWALVPAGLLAVVRAFLTPIGISPQIPADAVLEGLFEIITVMALLATSCWLFRQAGGDTGLRDPQSATLFLLLPAGAGAVFTLVRVLPAALVAEGGFSFPREFLAFWMAQLLGVAAVAAPLLVFVTPLLIGRRLVRPDGWWLDAAPLALASRTHESFMRSVAQPVRLGIGPWLEIAALGAAGMVMASISVLASHLFEAAGWHLWGVPLLLVVWAGVRQGLPGATLVAGSIAILGLTLLTALRPETQAPTVLQVNVLAQCATGLLVAGSVTWVRQNETRYRQVVAQAPVALYTTRTIPGDSSTRMPQAEVVFVSPPAETILGCPPNELLGDFSRWLQRVHIEDREIVQAAVSQLALHTEPVTFEYRLEARGATIPPSSPLAPRPSSLAPLPSPLTIRWIREVMVPHRGADGRLTGWDGMASDITSQRDMADDLRRTSSMFHALLDHLPAGVFFMSAKTGRPILVNPRARQLLGQREDTAAGFERLAQVYRLFRPDGTPYPADELPVCQVLRRGAVSMRDDIVVHRADGRRVPLISWAAPVDVGHSGRADAVVWVLEDLTELRQAEAARHETEGRLRTVIESLGEGLLVQDRHGAVIDCNSAARTLMGRHLGLRPYGVVEGGDHAWLCDDESVLPEEDHPPRKVLRTGLPVRNVVLGIPRPPRPEARVGGSSAESSGILVAGRTRWVLVNSLPLAPKPGATPAGVVTTLADITDYIHAQQLIRESEERFRGLVDSLPLMLVQFDAELRIVFMNPATTNISGYTIDDVREPQAWMQLLRPEDLPAVQNGFTQALAGQANRIETRYRAKDGQERVGYCMLQPRRESEAPGSPIVGVTALVVDMTKERRLESELERAQRLELVGRLSSGIAHDFNNLLTVLLGLTDLAREELPESHPVQYELQRIGEVGEQAANLARQILEFGKQRGVPLHRIEVNHSVNRIAGILRTLLPEGMDVGCHVTEEELHVQADEIQLQQVLMNLCLNARDAMSSGGTIELTTSIHTRLDGREKGVGTLLCEAPSGPSRQKGPDPFFTAGTPTNETAIGPERWVCLAVRDTGVGMAEELRRRIFEPFFSTKERGTGLGLAVVQQIVSGFGGRIEVTSEVGRGSVFEVWLPLLE